MSDRLTEEMESRRKMGDKLSHERHQSQKEKECTQEVGLVSLCTKYYNTMWDITVMCQMFLCVCPLPLNFIKFLMILQTHVCWFVCTTAH